MAIGNNAKLNDNALCIRYVICVNLPYATKYCYEFLFMAIGNNANLNDNVVCIYGMAYGMCSFTVCDEILL